jgi:hypothetical protein
VPTDFIDPVEAEIRFVSDLYESWNLRCKFQIIRHFSPVKFKSKDTIQTNPEWDLFILPQ